MAIVTGATRTYWRIGRRDCSPKRSIGRPKIKPSRLEPSKKASQEEEENHDEATQKKEKKKRAGSAKRHKTKNLEIHETKLIQPSQTVPPNSEFKGYQDYTASTINDQCA